MNADWVLRLYPTAWRRRYEDELRDLLAVEPTTPGLVLDLIAGAVDAHLHPELAPDTTPHKPTPGEGANVPATTLMSRLRCRKRVNPRDVWLGLGASIALMIGLALIERLLGQAWGQSPAVRLLHYTILPAGLAMSFQFTQYRGASFGARAAMGVLTFLITYIPFVLLSTGGKL